MFASRLRRAFLLMGLLAVVQGAVGWSLLSIAEHRIIRGRLAADLHFGLLELSAEKHRLQAWSLETLLGAAPDAAQGQALVAAMLERIGTLRDAGVRAEALDHARAKDLGNHAARQAALARLEAALLVLRGELAGLAPAAGAPRARDRLDALFGGADGQDLRGLLRDALRAEAASVTQERAAADASLTQARQLALGGTILLPVLAVLLALLFTARLRRPVRLVQQAAMALARGALHHRIPPQRDGEFAALAQCMNGMAADLAKAQATERGLREGLEREVAARTQALSHALAELSGAEAERRQLFADIGHELRTPATVLRGEVEVALRMPAADAQAYRDVLERLRDTARQLGDLVEDVLVLASTEAAALSVDCTEVPAGEQVRAVVQAWQFLARERGVTLRHEAAAQDSLLWADPGRLRQVLGALLDNAVRYSHAGGEVSVRESREGAGWRLSVADRGIGVTAEEVPRLFARGYRAANARGHRADGTGLGLAIARTLAERLGGQVDLAPRPGGGCVARFSMPLLAREAAA